jgi:hypothetical protein
VDRLVIVSYPPADPAAGVWEGKFLQLTLRGEEHLVFAPRVLHQYHNQVLARFLGERAIPHRWIEPQTLDVMSRDVAVLGGGRFRVDTAARTLDLWDNSQAYGRFNEHGLVQKIAAAAHAWHAFRVQIS